MTVVFDDKVKRLETEKVLDFEGSYHVITYCLNHICRFHSSGLLKEVSGTVSVDYRKSFYTSRPPQVVAMYFHDHFELCSTEFSTPPPTSEFFKIAK